MGFWGSFPYFSILFVLGKGFCSGMIFWFLLDPARLPGLVSVLFFSFLLSGMGFCLIRIFWPFLVAARVPGFVSLILFSLFSGKG